MKQKNKPEVKVIDEDAGTYTITPITVLRSSLSSMQKIVYAAIKAYYRPGYPTTPSIGRIAGDLGVSRRSVERALCSLEQAGFIKRNQRRRSDGGITSNSYIFNDTPTTDLSHTPTTDLSHTLRQNCRIETKNQNNNNLFNINKNARARKNAAGDMPDNTGTPEQTDLKDFVPTNRDFEMWKALRKLGKQYVQWLVVVRVRQNYYLRPASKLYSQFLSDDEYNQAIDLIAGLAGNCRGLKFGQYLAGEITVGERIS